MTNATHTATNTGLGLVFFQADGAVGGFVRDGSDQFSVRGTFQGDHVVLDGPSHRIAYSKIEQRTDRHPVAKGTLLDKRTGVQHPIAVFRNTLEDGRVVHGLSLSGTDAKVVDAPF
jgi:hypothetical protein